MPKWDHILVVQEEGTLYLSLPDFQRQVPLLASGFREELFHLQILGMTCLSKNI